jgi:[ribosomal protein S5]-alanine N-acetyltransferase
MTELRTTRLLLRPWRGGDEGALVRHADNWNVARNLRDRFPHPYTLTDATAWLQRPAHREEPTLDFAIVLEGEAIGGIGLEPKSDIYRCGMEVGYWLAEAFWGRGIMSEAVRATVDYAFATFRELRVVQARHLASNPASGGVLLRCGFRLDGRLREAAVKAGVVDDVLVYSRTRGDEQAERAPLAPA